VSAAAPGSHAKNKSAVRARVNRLARDAGLTYAATAVTLGVSFLAGVIIARSLGPSGRGILTATLTLTDIASAIFAVGATGTVAYHVARRPSDGACLLSTWTLMLLPLCAIGIGVSQLLVPVLFAAQSEHTQDLARLYVLTLLITMLVQPLNGLIAGERRVGLWNAVRVAQPLGVLVLLLVLLAADELTVETALVANVAAVLIAAAAAVVFTLRRHGWAPPSLEVGRASLHYGLRGLPATFTQAVNMRLDLLIMPAFLAASSVGLYSVATNVSWLIVAVSSPLWWLVMPAAADQGPFGVHTVLASFHATLAISIGLAGLLAVTGWILVPAVYGDAFSPAVTSLYLLLPGCVLLAASTIITSGIYGAGRPFMSAVPHVLGSVVTIVGLLLFLERGGIQAAAIVTSTAYAVVFVVALVVYRRVAGLRWRNLLRSPAVVG
jgi:O-antigen/teichoic acid export membrane protein